jgi:hypothetical protein
LQHRREIQHLPVKGVVARGFQGRVLVPEVDQYQGEQENPTD